MPFFSKLKRHDGFRIGITSADFAYVSIQALCIFPCTFRIHKQDDASEREGSVVS